MNFGKRQFVAFYSTILHYCMYWSQITLRYIFSLKLQHSKVWLASTVRLSVCLCRRYGRRVILLLSIALQTVFGVAVAFAPNFTVYVILRFIVGTTISGVIINAFVLGTACKCISIALSQIQQDWLRRSLCIHHGFMLLLGKMEFRYVALRLEPPTAMNIH